MKVCLVSPPTVTDFEDPRLADSEAIRKIAEHAPLGILSLAATLEDIGITPILVDLNRWHYEFLGAARDEAPQDFCAHVVDRLSALEFDVLGLSTICSSYPLTLRIAAAARRMRPELCVLLGGPQASVTDVATLEALPGVADYVVRGEAEETLPRLLAAIAGSGALEDVAGVTYQTRTGIKRAPAAPLIADLDQLPFPAYHLYPSIKESPVVPLELGRGCPFACTFCSTNDFFRRRFRLKSPQRVLDHMRTIHRDYRIAAFDLVHDMFTVDRKRVVAFCEALIAADDGFTWGCSARTDCIDEELIELMYSAGCRGIFFGIETGSARMQKIIDKGLDLDQARQMVAACDRQEIKTAVSLIAGYPEEAEPDLRDTVAFFLDSLRFDQADPHVHLLAPLVDTPIYRQYRDALRFDADVVSDMSYQGWRLNAEDVDLIARYRDVFGNFYSVPTPHLDRSRLKELSDFLLYGSMRLRWLLVALHQEDDFVAVFDRWRAWRFTHRPYPVDDRPEPYYTRVDFGRGPDFVADFLQFLRDEAGAKRLTSTAIRALLEYENAVAGLPDVDLPEGTVHEVSLPVSSGDDDAVPVLAPGTVLITLDTDYNQLIRRLRNKKRLKGIRRGRVVMATRTTSDGDWQLMQLSPISAKLLELCDGCRTIGEIKDRFAGADEDFDGVPADSACLFGLEVLRQQRLVLLRDRGSALPSEADRSEHPVAAGPVG